MTTTKLRGKRGAVTLALRSNETKSVKALLFGPLAYVPEQNNTKPNITHVASGLCVTPVRNEAQARAMLPELLAASTWPDNPKEITEREKGRELISLITRLRKTT